MGPQAGGGVNAGAVLRLQDAAAHTDEMNPDDAYLAGLDFFDYTVTRFPADAWQNTSPCAGWNAIDVLGHIGSAVGFGTELLDGISSGTTPDWVPVDPPGQAVTGDAAAWWHALLSPARNAVRHVDMTQMVDTPVGQRSVAEGLAFPAIDLFVHAWDLGRAGELDVEIPQQAIDFSRAAVVGIPDTQLRSPQVFAAEVAPGSNATQSERFIAWTGRDPNWALP